MQKFGYEKIPLDLLQGLLDNPYEGMVIIDQHGITRHFSRALEVIYGISANQAVGRPLVKIVPNSRLYRVAQTGKAEIGETFSVRNRQVIVNRYPIKKDGKTIGAVGKVIFYDLKALITLKDKIKKLRSTVKQYRHELKEIHQARYSFQDILGQSPLLLRAKALAQRLAASDSTILLAGESGTGKELFAHAIHRASRRGNHPFIRVNCTSIPTELFESELFGYAPGAFTGAGKSGKAGKFELAHQGTIFLDEIGELPLGMQAKLLRVLQEKEVERLGSQEARLIDFRVIAATNRDLAKRLGEGYFRKDLYYRLNVVAVNLPALREMRSDVPLLSEHFLKKIQQHHQLPAVEVDPEVMDIFMAYDWPGNIRELRNVIERALIFCSAQRITKHDLPENLLNFQTGVRPLRKTTMDLSRTLKTTERDCLVDVLKKSGGNKTRAARLLNIHRGTLYYKIKKYQIRNNEIRSSAMVRIQKAEETK